MYNLLHKVQVMHDIGGGACETIGDLNKSLRSRYLGSVLLNNAFGYTLQISMFTTHYAIEGSGTAPLTKQSIAESTI